MSLLLFPTSWRVGWERSDTVRRFPSRLMLALLLSAAPGCVQPGIHINGGLIHNDTGRELQHIRVVHHETHRMIMSNSLLPGADFTLVFSEGEFKARTATVSWDDPALGVRQAHLDLPRRGSGDGPQWLVYRISSAGQVSAVLMPRP